MLTLRQFAWLAITEAASFMLLLVAMVFKHGFDMPGGVSIIGPIHGVLFIAYIAAAVLARPQAGWSWSRTAKIVLAGIVPIAGFIVAERLMKQPSAAAAL